MSNSRKHTPIFSMASVKSVKWYKRVWHGKLRARARDLIKHGDFDSLEIDLPYNDWDDPRDGKHYRIHFSEKEMRK